MKLYQTFQKTNAETNCCVFCAILRNKQLIYDTKGIKITTFHEIKQIV